MKHIVNKCLLISQQVSVIKCPTAFIRTEQLMEGRQRIQKGKANGEEITTRLNKAKRVTASFCWKERMN